MIIKNCISKKIITKNSIKNLSFECNKIFKQTSEDIANPKKTLHVLSKKFSFNFKLKDLKKFKQFKTIAIVGMGGSILGAEAIYSFLKQKIKKKVYFFNDLNEKDILDFKKKENLNRTLIFIISKSGHTIETLANTFLLNIIKKNSKNIILISDKKNNLLFNISKKLNIFFIEHKKIIGGRYSVLSEVGIVPAYLMGINISQLRSRTLKFLKGKNKTFLKESSVELAKLLNTKKIKNIIFLNYFPEIEKFLFWNQQLIAESLGKNGKGFLPTISNGPKDHHSLLQLYLDGPRDKIFYIFTFDQKSKNKIFVNKAINLNNYLNKKRISTVKNAQIKALLKVLKLKEIPFREFKIMKINEETLSELFSYFILETVMIGKLAKINPFNQPAVEQVKNLTKKNLN